MALLNFNANEVEPSTPMDAVPAGEYKAEIIESEMKPTKTGGEYLQITMRITDGPFASRLIWDRLNLRNNNSTAQEIAQRQLSAICHAVGRLNINDSAQLHNIPLIVKVTVKDDPAYGPKNEIKSYKSAGVAQLPGKLQSQSMAPPARTGQSAAAQQNASSPSKQTPPWQRGAA